MGGKGSLFYNADGSMSYVYDFVASFQHAIQGAVALGTAGFSYLGQLETEITSRLAAGQITAQQAQKLHADVALAKLDLAATLGKGQQANEGLKIQKSP